MCSYIQQHSIGGAGIIAVAVPLSQVLPYVFSVPFFIYLTTSLASHKIHESQSPYRLSAGIC